MQRITLYILITLFQYFCLSAQNCQPEIVLVTTNPVNNNLTIYYKTCPEYHTFQLLRIAETGVDTISGLNTSYVNLAEELPNTGNEYQQFGPRYIEGIADSSMEIGIKGLGTTEDENSKDSWPPVNTLFIHHEYDSCKATLELQWNNYKNWKENIEKYELVIKSTTSNTIIHTATFNEGNNRYGYEDLPLNDEYLIYITATARNTMWAPEYDSTTSNGIRMNTYHARSPEYLYAAMGTLNQNNKPTITFQVDPNTEFNTYQVLRATSPTGPFEHISTITTVDNTITFTDESVDASTQIYYYQLSALNYCGTLISYSENLAQTIQLSASNTNYTANLNWNEYQNWPAGIAYYSVERSVNNGVYTETGTSLTPQYDDSSLEEIAGTGVNNNICYRVIAHESVGTPYNLEPALSRSNSTCISIPVNIQLYDAFMPNNPDYDGFEPKFDFLPPYYDFKIFNRTGTVVYHSNDAANTRWNGTGPNGKPLPQGIYRYTLLYNDSNNQRQVMQGSITLIRE